MPNKEDLTGGRSREWARLRRARTQWGVPPKQIAVRVCATCGHIHYAKDVNRLDAIQQRPCKGCGDVTTVHLYAYAERVQ